MKTILGSTKSQIKYVEMCALDSSDAVADSCGWCYAPSGAIKFTGFKLFCMGYDAARITSQSVNEG